MTANQPDPLPTRDPGASFAANKPAATTQAPQTPDGWLSPYDRPNAWAAFGSNTQQEQPSDR